MSDLAHSAVGYGHEEASLQWVARLAGRTRVHDARGAFPSQLYINITISSFVCCRLVRAWRWAYTHVGSLGMVHTLQNHQ